MGLLPPVILGALLIVAFALSSQQRLALDSHTGPSPARQLAYQMRVHHQGAVALKQADPSLNTVIDSPPATMNVGDSRFLSCINGKYVATAPVVIGDSVTLMPFVSIPATLTGAVIEELSRQSVMAPELGRMGSVGWSSGYDGVRSVAITPIAGVGMIDAGQITTAAGPLPPLGCIFPVGAPVIVTQVLP